MQSLKFFLKLSLIVGFILGCAAGCYKVQRGTVVATVTGKERFVTSDKSYYLIFTDKETFKNADSWFFYKWNSSDYQGKLQEGKTYEFKVFGFRIPFMSKYRNITSFKEFDYAQEKVAD